MIVYFVFILAVVPVYAVLRDNTCGTIVSQEPLPPFQDPHTHHVYTYVAGKWAQQITPAGSQYFLGGFHHTESTGINTKHHYTNGDGGRSSVASFVCAPDPSQNMVIDVLEEPLLYYRFTIGSADCCTSPPPPPPPRPCGSFANTAALTFTPPGEGGRYTVNPFQSVTVESSNAVASSTGTYYSTEGTGTAVAHYYTNGAPCWLGQVQTILLFECRDDASVEEIKQSVVTDYACTHTLTIYSAACCPATPMPSLHPTRVPSLYPTRAPTVPSPTSCDRDPWSFKGLRVNSDFYGIQIIVGVEVMSHDGINHGRYASSVPPASLGLITQHYLNGDAHQTCASPEAMPYGHRSSVIQFHCGLRREVVQVAEGSPCQKVIRLTMPGCCTTSEWNELYANRQTSTSVSTSTLTATGDASPIDVDTDVDGSTSATHVDTDMGVTTTTSNTDVELPVAVNVTSSPDVTVSIDTTSPTDLSLPVDSTSSTDVSLPIDISSAPHVTLNLHLDNKEDRDDGLDSSANTATIVILIVMSMFCLLLVSSIVYSATAQNVNGCDGKHASVDAAANPANQLARFEL